jgi:hypothetical protein
VLYLDSSALVKRYVTEAGTAVVAAAIAATLIRATSIVAYAELRAAFTRALHAARLDRGGHASVIARLDADWPNFLILAADDSCVRDAGRLIDTHASHRLRGFDAMHLAAAHRLAAGNPAAVSFACWDVRLWRAARDDGFTMIPRAEPA